MMAAFTIAGMRSCAMTPGLAGFIASGRDDHGWEQSVVDVLAALSAEFEVVPERDGEPVGAGRRTLLDTFDWRLYKAGLTLEYAARSAGGELRLADHAVNATATADAPRSGTTASTRATRDIDAPDAAKPVTAPPAITQPVTGWQAARPHLMGELPDGPVAARIGDLVDPRALLPVVAVITTTVTHRLLNEDGKTVARLRVERSAVGGQRSGPHATALAPRLSVAEVRGYPGPARRAARLVGAVPGIESAELSAFAEALRAVGRRPGDYSNKVDAGITAAMPASQAAATILLRLLDTIDANVAGVLADTDTEFLHDLRVSVRRSRSALKLFGDVLTAAPGPSGPATLSAKDVAFFAAEFKWVGDLTTPTRDLDVHLLDFDDTAHSLSAAKPDDLEPFRSYLEQRRRREFRLLTRGLRSPRFTELSRGWRAKLTTVKDSNPAGAGTTVRSGRGRQAAGGTTGTLAAERTRAAFAKVARRGAEITPGSPAESLHDLRKRCKELRYALEFFAPLYDRGAQAKVVGELKRLQDCLGEFQDTQVQIGEIRALATAMLAAGEAPAVTLLAMGEVTAGLMSRQRAAREDFDRRFAAFAGIDGQRRMSALLRGKPGVGS
jgi:CHAD domain-containing protein